MTSWFDRQMRRIEEPLAGLGAIAALAIDFYFFLRRFRLYMVPWRLEGEPLSL